MPCEDKTIKNSVITNTIGGGVLCISLLLIILLAVLKSTNNLPVPDLAFWILIILLVVGGVISTIGSSVAKGCVAEKFADFPRQMFQEESKQSIPLLRERNPKQE